MTPPPSFPRLTTLDVGLETDRQSPHGQEDGDIEHKTGHTPLLYAESVYASHCNVSCRDDDDGDDGRSGVQVPCARQARPWFPQVSLTNAIFLAGPPRERYILHYMTSP